MSTYMDITNIKGKVCNFEIKLSFNDNPEIYYCQIFIYPIGSDDFVCQLVDLTNDKKEYIRLQLSLEDKMRELKNNNDDLAIVNSELKNFAYIVSHDLAEPLRMISSWSGLLADEYKDKLDANANSYIDFIIEGAKRLRGQISDILDLSRINTHKLEFGDVNLDSVLGDVFNSIFLLLEENDVEIISDDLPTIKADYTQFCRLFQNLITNSVKFRHPDRPIIIHIRCVDLGDFYEISFEDNGVGFDQSKSELIFQVFQRLDPTYAGSGIGLAICRKIIDQHGGKIWAKSSPNKGATFLFTVPK